MRASIEQIEECYEFMLAYAAQGRVSGDTSPVTVQLREYLERAAGAISGLGMLLHEIVDEATLEPAARYHAFGAVLERDASSAEAAIQLVLAQSAIGSQVVDNLNASVHVRALLTDLFLIDEVLKGAVPASAPQP
jgi:hypothetical protein